MALEIWLKGKVIRIADETNDTRRFWIEVPELDNFNFIPGQFVTVDLPIDEKPNKRWRRYSIASWPDGTNVFELIIVMDKGAGTPYFFEQVKVGSELNLCGPEGIFILKEPLDKDVFMICTGTGIAPFRSMIHHIINHNILHHNIYLIFGCRTKASLLYYNEMTKLQEMVRGFHYIPTLSKEQWERNTGYVHPIYELLCMERKPASFFLSGCKGMIDDAKKIIMKMGYDGIIIQ
ncbi:MAG: oxidoreductase [Nitrosopumilus sp.]|nr:oxidoreductase [Nitrosopumilus sp.]